MPFPSNPPHNLNVKYCLIRRVWFTFKQMMLSLNSVHLKHQALAEPYHSIGTLWYSLHFQALDEGGPRRDWGHYGTHSIHPGGSCGSYCGASQQASLTMSLEPARLSSSPHTLRSSVHMGLVEGSWIMCKQCGVGREKSHRKHSRNSGIYGSSSYC